MLLLAIDIKEEPIEIPDYPIEKISIAVEEEAQSVMQKPTKEHLLGGTEDVSKLCRLCFNPAYQFQKITASLKLVITNCTNLSVSLFWSKFHMFFSQITNLNI